MLIHNRNSDRAQLSTVRTEPSAAFTIYVESTVPPTVDTVTPSGACCASLSTCRMSGCACYGILCLEWYTEPIYDQP